MHFLVFQIFAHPARHVAQHFTFDHEVPHFPFIKIALHLLLGNRFLQTVGPGQAGQTPPQSVFFFYLFCFSITWKTPKESSNLHISSTYLFSFLTSPCSPFRVFAIDRLCYTNCVRVVVGGSSWSVIEIWP